MTLYNRSRVRDQPDAGTFERSPCLKPIAIAPDSQLQVDPVVSSAARSPSRGGWRQPRNGDLFTSAASLAISEDERRTTDTGAHVRLVTAVRNWLGRMSPRRSSTTTWILFAATSSVPDRQRPRFRSRSIRQSTMARANVAIEQLLKVTLRSALQRYNAGDGHSRRFRTDSRPTPRRARCMIGAGSHTHRRPSELTGTLAARHVIRSLATAIGQGQIIFDRLHPDRVPAHQSAADLPSVDARDRAADVMLPREAERRVHPGRRRQRRAGACSSSAFRSRSSSR